MIDSYVDHMDASLQGRGGRRETAIGCSIVRPLIKMKLFVILISQCLDQCIPGPSMCVESAYFCINLVNRPTHMFQVDYVPISVQFLFFLKGGYRLNLTIYGPLEEAFEKKLIDLCWLTNNGLFSRRTV